MNGCPVEVNERFERLLVTSTRMVNGRRVATCLCDCGATKDVRATHLRAGATTSCGCWQKEVASAMNGTHRASETTEFTIWNGMRQRCTDPNSTKFYRYGGRGIQVCDRWQDFATFLEDMGPRPSPRHSIDRVDNDGNYEPGNCRWATAAEQARNKHHNPRRGERSPMAKLTAENVGFIRQSDESHVALARRFGVTPQAIGHIRRGKNWRAA